MGLPFIPSTCTRRVPCTHRAYATDTERSPASHSRQVLGLAQGRDHLHAEGRLPGEMMLQLVRRAEEGLAGKQVRHQHSRWKEQQDAGSESQGRGRAGSSRSQCKLGVQTRREGSRGGAPGENLWGAYSVLLHTLLPTPSLLTRSEGKSR